VIFVASEFCLFFLKIFFYRIPIDKLCIDLRVLAIVPVPNTYNYFNVFCIIYNNMVVGFGIKHYFIIVFISTMENTFKTFKILIKVSILNYKKLNNVTTFHV